MKVVISLGGSVLTKELTGEHFKKYADLMKELSKKHKIIVVIGGGKVCREYQKVAKDCGAGEKGRDFIGIMSTHLNAATFASCLGDGGYLVAWKPLKKTVSEIKKNFGKKTIICGGYDVGTSSDYDAAYFAHLVKADLLINASNVSGVYSEDPKLNPEAPKLYKITHDELIEILKNNMQSPGEYRLFDLKAAKLIKKFGIRTILIDGNNPDEIANAVEGRHDGTIVG